MSGAIKIFISYSRNDIERVREICNAITSHFPEYYCKVWIDEAELLAGQYWQQEIDSSLATSDVVLVCLSKKMLASRGYVHREWRLALDVQKEMPENRIYIIPVRLDSCDVPSSLCKFHWVNWFEDFGKRLLLKTLKHALEEKPPPLWARNRVAAMSWLALLLEPRWEELTRIQPDLYYASKEA
jgi:hypothetical protein